MALVSRAKSLTRALLIWKPRTISDLACRSVKLLLHHSLKPIAIPSTIAAGFAGIAALVLMPDNQRLA